MRAAASLAAVALGAVLLLLRQRGAGALDTVWAEDGAIFLQQALSQPGIGAWLQSYGGYLHLAPRILAGAAAGLPLSWAATFLAATAALCAAAVAVVAYHASGEHIPGRGVRFVLALAVLLVPPAGLEVANAAANLHWYLLYAAAWVSLWTPARRTGIAAGTGTLFLTAASDPFAGLVAPIVGLRLLRDRRAVDWAFAAALAAGLVLQAAVILQSAGSRPLDPLESPVDLMRWYGFHVLEPAVFGVALREAANAALGEAGAGSLALLLLAPLLLPALRAAREQPFVPATLIALHLGFYVAPVAVAGFSSSRYTITPILVLYAVIAWGVARSPASLARPVGSLAVALLATLAILDFAPPNARAAGPRWSAELARETVRCRASPGDRAVLSIPPLPADDPADPGRPGRLWRVEMPCERLLAAEGLR